MTRIRVRDRRLSPEQLQAITHLAREHGNGLLEITARGNLQVRGLGETTWRPFAETVGGLLDLEQGLVIDMSPLAGDDPLEQRDPRPLTHEIRQLSLSVETALGPKVSVVVDGAGQVSLSALKADILLMASPAGWLVSVGQQIPVSVHEVEAVRLATTTLHRLAERGPTARATDLSDSPTTWTPPHKPLPLGRIALRQTHAAVVGLPFGACLAEDVLSLVQLGRHHHVREYRLAPAHGLVAVGAGTPFLAEARRLGLITDGDDPRLRVSACIGSEGCRSGLLPARRLAARLAPSLPAGQHLHVSGCSKGCAHPAPAPLTLVGRPQGPGLVIGGRASDTPAWQLADGEIEPVLARAAQRNAG